MEITSKGVIEAVSRVNGKLLLAKSKGYFCMVLLAYLYMCDIQMILVVSLRALLEYPAWGNNIAIG